MREYIKRQLGKWAHEIFLKVKPEVIGITGSIAKTSTKEAIFAVMKEEFGEEVFCNPGNLNNEFGLPLAILGFDRSLNIWRSSFVLIKAWFRMRFRKNYAHYWVLEMGADRPGDIKYLTNIVRPNIALITAVGPAHLECLKSIEGVMEEKADLIRAVDRDGAVFLNKNNAMATKMANYAEVPVIFYDPKPDEIAQEAARAIGKYFKIEKDKIESGLTKLKAVNGRLKMIDGKNGAQVIDDSYNANPLSMEVALYSLDKIAKKTGAKRRVAILGEMLDLGDYSKKAHEDLKELTDRYVDYKVGVGEAMKALEPDEWYKNVREAEERILKNLRSDDIILVKGSRVMGLEKIVEKLVK